MVQRLSAGRWFAHRLMSWSARENPGLERTRSWLVAEWERGHPGSLRTAGTALNKFDGRPLLDRHDRPVAVVVTTRDRLVRPTRQRELAEAYGAEVIELDAGHNAPVAAPDGFADAFIEGIELVSSRAG
jgi:pimeloyl-ACP methyl ester carboxylesterase